MRNLKNTTCKYLKACLIFTILLNFLLGYKVVKAKYFTYQPDYTYNRKDLFEHLNIESNSIVFLGSSLTAQFELGELLKNQNIKNRGINGDNTFGLLDRLAKVIQSRPQKIFLEIGINDIRVGIEKEILLNNYKKILHTLQQECKTTKLYVQSILPVMKTGLAIKNSLIKNEDIQIINKELQMYCMTNDITYINLYDNFKLNGEINPKYCIADGLHISGEGYLLWANLLEPYVKE